MFQEEAFVPCFIQLDYMNESGDSFPIPILQVCLGLQQFHILQRFRTPEFVGACTKAVSVEQSQFR